MDQKCFPRGGSSEKPVIQSRKFIFEKKKTSKPKKRKHADEPTKIIKLDKFIKLPQVQSPLHYRLKFEDVKPGFRTICAVQNIFRNFVVVTLPHFGMRAYLHKSNISNSFSNLTPDKKSNNSWFKMFYPGQILSCQVIKKPDVSHEGIEGIRESYTTVSVEPAVVNAKLNSGMISKHSRVQMAVSSVEDHGYMLESGIPGVMAFLPSAQAKKYAQNLGGLKSLCVGTIVWCYIVKSSVNSMGANVVEVRLPDHNVGGLECTHSFNYLWPGCKVHTTIMKVLNNNCCEVLVDGTDLRGIVNSWTDYTKSPSSEYIEGSNAQATLISYHPMHDVYEFSFSHDVLMMSQSMPYKLNTEAVSATIEFIDAAIHLNILHNGSSYRGVAILGSTKDGSNSTPCMEYKQGDLVSVSIISFDSFRRMYRCKILSKKIKEEKNELKEKKKKQKTKSKKDDTNGLVEADEIKQEIDSDFMSDNIEIKKEENESDYEENNDSGVEICSRSESNSSKRKNKAKMLPDLVMKDEDGGCYYQNDCDIVIKDEPMSDLELEVPELIEKKSKKSKTPKLSDKDKINSNCSVIRDESECEVEEVAVSKKKKAKSKTEINSVGTKRKKSFGNVESSVNKKLKMEADNESKLHLSDVIKKKMKEVSQLSLQDVDSQFLWDATPDDLAKITTKDVEDFEEESDDEKITKKPLSKSQRKANELEKERKIQEKEEELLKACEEPKSADHYERIILSKPDDSKVWIKYMAFHLEATEIEKAKAVGTRALKIIGHRNEQDRLNIWLALLNLEHLYGSKESFKEIWAEALKCNDDYKVNSKVLDLYTSSQNAVEVNNLVKKMTKHYRENSECWYLCLSSLMNADMKDKARDLLQRALKTLPPKTHVTLISRFALLENTFNNNDEAQALFDNLLTSYPARVDIWFVYIDMLTKSNLIDLARHVFERAANVKLPAKKMKSVYKKWLEFEEKHGSIESVGVVRESAVKYVENVTKNRGL